MISKEDNASKNRNYAFFSPPLYTVRSYCIEIIISPTIPMWNKLTDCLILSYYDKLGYDKIRGDFRLTYNTSEIHFPYSLNLTSLTFIMA